MIEDGRKDGRVEGWIDSAWHEDDFFLVNVCLMFA